MIIKENKKKHDKIAFLAKSKIKRNRSINF